jgi:hypothetical protein
VQRNSHPFCLQMAMALSELVMKRVGPHFLYSLKNVAIATLAPKKAGFCAWLLSSTPRIP